MLAKMRNAVDSWAFLMRATATTECGLQPQLLRRLLGPDGGAVRAAATKASADGLKLRFRLR